MGEGVSLRGAPRIRIAIGASIMIGAGVALLSIRNGRGPRTHLLCRASNARIEIGSATIIDGASISTRSSVVIGRHCKLEPGCQVLDHVPAHLAHLVPPGASASGNVSIGEGARLGAGCTILPGARVAAGEVIAAGAVVAPAVEAHAAAEQATRPAGPSKAKISKLAARPA